MPPVVKLGWKRFIGWKRWVKVFLLSVKNKLFALFLLCSVSLRIFFCVVDKKIGLFGLFTWKNKTDRPEGVRKLFYQHCYDLLRQWKMVKVSLENIITSYDQITKVLESLLGIREVNMQEVKITRSIDNWTTRK